MTCRLGLPIPDGAIEEMRGRLVVTDEDLKVAAAEGKSSPMDSIPAKLWPPRNINSNYEP